jgi:hypothetical protein
MKKIETKNSHANVPLSVIAERFNTVKHHFFYYWSLWVNRCCYCFFYLLCHAYRSALLLLFDITVPLLFICFSTSPIPYISFFCIYTHKKILNFSISNISEQQQKSSALQRYSDNAMLQFSLSHNALSHWRKLLLVKVIVSSSLEPLSHPEVITLSKFGPLSLSKCYRSGTWCQQ